MSGFKRINEHLNVIYKQLKYYRKQEDLSYEDLSKRLQLQGVNMLKQRICEIEQDKRAVRDFEIYALAKALGISIYDLLADTEEILEEDKNNKD